MNNLQSGLYGKISVPGPTDVVKKQNCTPGPWRVGRGSFVISDNPSLGIRGSDDVETYGGHMICESVSQANAKLIAVAPEMREILASIENDANQIPEWLWKRIKDVLEKSGEPEERESSNENSTS